MKKIFGILPFLGGLAFFLGAYLFYVLGPIIGAPFYFSAIIFIICGLGFFVWGLKALLKIKNESVSYKEGQILKNTGAKITANIAHLEQVTNVKINGRSPYVIYAKAVNQANGKEQVFKSFWLWSDPLAQAQAGRGVDIYLDRFNPQKYYLDVESIGLPAEQSRVSNIVKITLIAIILILVASGIIVFAVYQKNKKYFDLIDKSWPQIEKSFQER